MKPTRYLILPLAFVLLAPTYATTTDQPNSLSFSLEDYAMLVEELNIRRRVNVLYPNPQSIFDGLQAGFVNVSTGNLTFQRRDLVARAGGAVAFARVYDSSSEGSDDFGRGWRVSLAEELLLDGVEVIYIDRHGAQHRFRQTTAGTYVATPPTPRHAGTRIELGNGRSATMTEGSGTVRIFKPVGAMGGRLRVASVVTSERRLDFRYASGGLEAVVYGNRTLFTIRRRAGDGRIVAVGDAHGRKVRYSYTAGGQLKDVYDLAGNLWWHEYDVAGRLTAAVGGNRRPYLLASYDDMGRAVESRTGRHFTISYAAASTTVVDGSGARYIFHRNPAGTSVALSSTTGGHWRLRLNAANQVKVAELPGKTLEYDYDTHGRVTFTAETTTAGRDERSFHYDASGRLSSVTATGPLTITYTSKQVDVSGAQGLRYELATAGRVASVWDGNKRIDAEYRDGELVVLRRYEQSVRFSRDAVGHLVEITYPSGQANRYFHDALGNRRLVEFGLGGSVRYRYDAAGNLVAVKTTAADGAMRRQTTTVGDMNRVERIVYEGGAALDIAYDGMGRPVMFETGNDRVSATYDTAGQLIQIASKATGEVWTKTGAEQVSAKRTLAAQRLAALSGDTLGASQPDYGPLGFADVVFRALPLDAVEAGVPGLAAARDLLAAAVPLFGVDRAAMVAFEKPSNTIFQPAEYRSTNCCVSSNHCTDCVPYGICPTCSNQTMDGVAKSELLGYAEEPFERGFTMLCSGGQPS